MASKAFDYEQDFTSINFRNHPERYQVGRGEQGVLLVEPNRVKSCPGGAIKTFHPQPNQLKKSTSCLRFIAGMMILLEWIWPENLYRWGIYTRARRYANYKGGKKYAEDGSTRERGNDPMKAGAAAVFKKWWDKIRMDEDYLQRKREHISRWG